MRRAVLLLLILVTGPAALVAGPAAAERPKPGADAPRFTAPLLQGGQIDMSTYIGRNAVLLDFWSVYCVACVRKLPVLVDIYNRYEEKGLVAVGVNLDSFGTRRVRRFVNGLSYEIPFPIVVDRRREAGGRYGVSVLPTTVVIDREGKVIYYGVGYSPGDEAKLDDKVREALGLAR